MLFVHPDTPALRPSSYFAPRSCEHPNQGYFQLHPNVPQFAVPPYPASQQRFFHRPSQEELEQREYQRAVAVISNYRHRQAEKEAAIRRQRQAEVAQQLDLNSMMVELERRRQQEESLSSNRAEIIRTRRALDRLAAAEHQIAVNEFLGRVKGAQPVIRQSHAANRKSFYHDLKHRLPNASDTDDAERVRDFLSSLGSHPVHSEKPENLNEDSAKFVESFLSSLFPGFVFHAQPEAGNDQTAPAAHVPKEVSQKPRATNIAATSTTSNPSPSEESTSPAKLDVTETEVAEVDHTTSLSSIQQVRNNLSNVQTSFVLPPQLDHYALSADDHNDTASPLSTSSSDLTKLIPYTGTNEPVYKYEHELNGLLEELDRIESHGDAEVRDKRKETVKAIERALEDVERVVGEAVKERLSTVVPSTPVAEELLKGFDVDEGVIEEAVVAPTEELVDTPAIIDDAAVLEERTPTEPEATVDVPVKEVTLAGGTLPESNTPTVPDNAGATPHDETSPNPLDLGPSTSIAISELVEPSVTEPGLVEPQLPTEEVEAADTFLLAEEAVPRSPVKQVQMIENDIEDMVLVPDDEDWSVVDD